jgi:hypothetical protein
MTSTQLVPVIIFPLIAWRVYSRIRRNIGRQHFRPGRMTGAIVFFSLITLLIGLGAANQPAALAALGSGVLIGIPLALYGLHLTRFETTPDGRFYTPNTGIGVALTVLFLGRLGYRMYALMSNPPAAGAPPLSLYQSPLTLLIYGLIAGYYIAYYTGARSRGLKQT